MLRLTRVLLVVVLGLATFPAASTARVSLTTTTSTVRPDRSMDFTVDGDPQGANTYIAFGAFGGTSNNCLGTDPPTGNDLTSVYATTPVGVNQGSTWTDSDAGSKAVPQPLHVSLGDPYRISFYREALTPGKWTICVYVSSDRRVLDDPTDRRGSAHTELTYETASTSIAVIGPPPVRACGRGRGGIGRIAARGPSCATAREVSTRWKHSSCVSRRRALTQPLGQGLRVYLGCGASATWRCRVTNYVSATGYSFVECSDRRNDLRSIAWQYFFD